MKKEIKYYSPSLEINRLNDKAKLIISGLGNGQLVNYMVMFFIVKEGTVNNEFDHEQYRKAKFFEQEMTISQIEKLLNEFITSEPLHQLAGHFANSEEVLIDDTVNPLGTWIARIGGPLLTILCLYVIYRQISNGVGLWPIAFVFGLMLLFLIGSIKFE